MKKLILSLIIFLVAFSCSTRKLPVSTQVSEDVVIEQTTGDKYFTAGELVNYTDFYKEKHFKAIEIINSEVHGECFKSKLLESKLIQTNGKSNEDVYSHIISSNVVVDLELYRSSKFSPFGRNVHGYTKDGVNKIWFNTKFHYYYGYCSSASNMFHESLHKLGYIHDFYANKDRPKSVPYAGGRIMNECCELKYGEKY